MNKPVALIKMPIKNKMYVGIHKTKGQNHYFVLLYSHKNPVHPFDEIIFVSKDSVNEITVCAEMPAIMNWILLPFEIRNVQR